MLRTTIKKQKDYRGLKDKRGVSSPIAQILLVALAVILVGFLAAYGTGFLPKGRTPIAQFSIYDHPDEVSTGDRAFVIKEIGGDSIPLTELRVVVYNATSNLVVYSNIVGRDLANFTLVNIYGPENQALDAGEQLIASSNVVGGHPGTYIIELSYEPTKQVIASNKITIQ